MAAVSGYNSSTGRLRQSKVPHLLDLLPVLRRLVRHFDWIPSSLFFEYPASRIQYRAMAFPYTVALFQAVVYDSNPWFLEYNKSVDTSDGIREMEFVVVGEVAELCR